MENNPELQLAWQFIENTGTHLFLTGKAGTGKTTFLRRLKEHTPKRMVILAPTGIAAINAGGVTIHSFFQLSFAPFVPETTFNSSQTHYRYSKEKRNIIRSMDLLVIDEISMVLAALLSKRKWLLIKPQVGTLYFKDGMLIRKASFMMILIGFFQLGVIFTKIRLFSIVSLPKIL